MTPDIEADKEARDFIDAVFRRNDALAKAKSLRVNIKNHISALETLGRDEKTVWLLTKLDRSIKALLAELEQ